MALAAAWLLAPATFSLLLPATVLMPAPAAAQAELTGEAAVDTLPPRYQQWLASVELLMSDVEREAFLALSENYQRDHFIRRFWKVRDPFLETPRNELQEIWVERAAAARALYPSMEGDRVEMFLLFGPPSRRIPLMCTEVLQPLEVWAYDDGSERIRGFFSLVFYGHRGSGGIYQRLWQPSDGLTPLAAVGARVGGGDSAIAGQVSQKCLRADEILSYLAQSLDMSRVEDRFSLVPEVNDEWVLAFLARSTDVAADAEPLSGELLVSFPGRHQSRTVVQGMVAVPRAELGFAEVGGQRSYNLLIDGEILKKGDLFDQFRYRFDFPEGRLPGAGPGATGQVPLVIQRYLRPGEYELIVKVEDVNSKRVFRQQRQLEVPRVERSRAPVAAAGAAPGAAPAALEAAAAGTANEPAPLGHGVVGELKMLDDRLEEANSSIATGDHTIRILPLPHVLSVGRLRVRAEARGEGIARVAFELNDRPMMRKSKPPYSVEINLGDSPRVHTLRAIALNSAGAKLAADEVLINAGPHRFAIRLIEPQRGKQYRHSVRAHVEVEVPEGDRLDRVELYLNETKVATLYQPPFEQPILLGDEDLSYVRAVAVLRDGATAEDVRFVNAPDYVDEVRIHLVELFTSVLDRRGNFVEDLKLEDLSIFEGGVEQEVRRFEAMRDLPMRAGLVLDTSTSMMSSLHKVKTAAHRFFENVLTPRDRAALITFNDEPRLVSRFTNDKEVLAGGLAGLTTEGETALYDSIIFTLHYFSGLKGRRAIVVLTDGEDSSSEYSYEDAVDFARRTGVGIYIVGLRLSSKSDIRMKMRRLANETGGELFLIDSASQLERIYATIQEELRSQYLIAYQSSAQGGDGEFRKVEIKMHRRGLEAKTIPGYFP